MEIKDFIRDYICDADEGLKALVTFFLNLVMQYEPKAADRCREAPETPQPGPRVGEREQTGILTHEPWQTNFAETTISR